MAGGGRDCDDDDVREWRKMEDGEERRGNAREGRRTARWRWRRRMRGEELRRRAWRRAEGGGRVRVRGWGATGLGFGAGQRNPHRPFRIQRFHRDLNKASMMMVAATAVADSVPLLPSTSDTSRLATSPSSSSTRALLRSHQPWYRGNLASWDHPRRLIWSLAAEHKRHTSRSASSPASSSTTQCIRQHNIDLKVRATQSIALLPSWSLGSWN
ncbi:hypothetical protein DAI22_02g125300 [Oryza sativa Japonica Group]|nr:hypothetical protein DAI22_02g125300 [Oryza sativa Japonica Group]KAF2944219.1 hypothetical protein DAI22_02g125300 [Oryza sativa Japonica Group]KAF2944220.1 hypothetical protein DAI22_02g125300 [Oryza sativa Japonica Group]